MRKKNDLYFNFDWFIFEIIISRLSRLRCYTVDITSLTEVINVAYDIINISNNFNAT